MTHIELKEFRASLGLTQVQIAERFGVLQCSWSIWERNLRKIPPYIEKAIELYRQKNPVTP